MSEHPAPSNPYESGQPPGNYLPPTHYQPGGGQGFHAPPPQKGGSGWKVLLIILVAMVVCCAGVGAAGWLAFRKVADTAGQALERLEPREVKPGASVRIAEVTVEEGWQIKVGKQRARVRNLTVTRGESDEFFSTSSLSLTFTLYQGSKQLSRVRCSGSVPSGSTLAVECSPSFDDARSFDRVTVELF